VEQNIYAGRREQIFSPRHHAAFKKADVIFNRVGPLWWTATLDRRQSAILKAAGVSFWKETPCAR